MRVNGYVVGKFLGYEKRQYDVNGQKRESIRLVISQGTDVIERISAGKKPNIDLVLGQEYIFNIQFTSYIDFKKRTQTPYLKLISVEDDSNDESNTQLTGLDTITS